MVDLTKGMKTSVVKTFFRRVRNTGESGGRSTQVEHTGGVPRPGQLEIREVLGQSVARQPRLLVLRKMKRTKTEQRMKR